VRPPRTEETAGAGALAAIGLTGKEVDTIVDLLPAPLFFLTRGGDVVHANRAACALAGAAVERLVARPIDDVLSIRALDNTIVAEAVARNVAVSGRCTVKGGERVVLSAQPLTVGATCLVVLTVSTAAVLGSRGRRDGAARDDHDEAPGRAGDGSSDVVVAASPALAAVRACAERCATVDAPVLLVGEPGSGKSLFASLIHRHSRRRERPFLTVSCGGIPPERLEVELFGRGPREDERTPQAGALKRADRGSLVLDDVSQLPPALQTRLLRFLETGDAWPVQGDRPERLDVRIMATTAHDLRRLVAQRAFRGELFYRLGVLVVRVPPLRDHPEDVPALVEALLDRLAARVGLRKRVTAEALEIMKRRPFRGNVRELANLVERLVLTLPGDVIDAAQVRDDDAEPSLPPIAQLLGGERVDLRKALREVEAAILREALRRFGTQARAAQHLGVAQATVARKSKQYGLGG